MSKLRSMGTEFWVDFDELPIPMRFQYVVIGYRKARGRWYEVLKVITKEQMGI